MSSDLRLMAVLASLKIVREGVERIVDLPIERVLLC